MDGANCTCKKLNDGLGIVVYQPKLYQDRPDVVFYTILDFVQGMDCQLI